MSLPLEVDDLRISFATEDGPVQAVRGISFSVGEGELLGVVGESGSGKSVSFLAAMGLLPDSAQIEGSIKVSGTEVVGASSKELRAIRGKQAAMIFQDPLTALNPTHRIGRQLSEMVLAHNSIPQDDARSGRHPQRHRASPPVPPRILRRHAPAGVDRDGDRQQPQAADRG